MFANFSSTDFDDSKLKRAGGGSVGLFPFPRVGRSDPDMISEWETPVSYNEFENYDGNDIEIVNLDLFSSSFHRFGSSRDG